MKSDSWMRPRFRQPVTRQAGNVGPLVWVTNPSTKIVYRCCTGANQYGTCFGRMVAAAGAFEKHADLSMGPICRYKPTPTPAAPPRELPSRSPALVASDIFPLTNSMRYLSPSRTQLGRLCAIEPSIVRMKPRPHGSRPLFLPAGPFLLPPTLMTPTSPPSQRNATDYS